MTATVTAPVVLKAAANNISPYATIGGLTVDSNGFASAYTPYPNIQLSGTSSQQITEQAYNSVLASLNLQGNQLVILGKNANSAQGQYNSIPNISTYSNYLNAVNAYNNALGIPTIQSGSTQVRVPSNSFNGLIADLNQIATYYELATLITLPNLTTANTPVQANSISLPATIGYGVSAGQKAAQSSVNPVISMPTNISAPSLPQSVQNPIISSSAISAPSLPQSVQNPIISSSAPLSFIPNVYSMNNLNSFTGMASFSPSSLSVSNMPIMNTATMINTNAIAPLNLKNTENLGFSISNVFGVTKNVNGNEQINPVGFAEMAATIAVSVATFGVGTPVAVDIEGSALLSRLSTSILTGAAVYAPASIGLGEEASFLSTGKPLPISNVETTFAANTGFSLLGGVETNPETEIGSFDTNIAQIRGFYTKENGFSTFKGFSEPITAPTFKTSILGDLKPTGTVQISDYITTTFQEPAKIPIKISMPELRYLSGGTQSPLQFSLDDAQSITETFSMPLSANIKEPLLIMTPKTVNVQTGHELSFFKMQKTITPIINEMETSIKVNMPSPLNEIEVIVPYKTTVFMPNVERIEVGTLPASITDIARTTKFFDTNGNLIKTEISNLPPILESNIKLQDKVFLSIDSNNNVALSASQIRDNVLYSKTLVNGENPSNIMAFTERPSDFLMENAKITASLQGLDLNYGIELNPELIKLPRNPFLPKVNIIESSPIPIPLGNPLVKGDFPENPINIFADQIEAPKIPQEMIPKEVMPNIDMRNFISGETSTKTIIRPLDMEEIYQLPNTYKVPTLSLPGMELNPINIGGILANLNLKTTGNMEISNLQRLESENLFNVNPIKEIKMPQMKITPKSLNLLKNVNIQMQDFQFLNDLQSTINTVNEYSEDNNSKNRQIPSFGFALKNNVLFENQRIPIIKVENPFKYMPSIGGLILGETIKKKNLPDFIKNQLNEEFIRPVVI